MENVLMLMIGMSIFLAFIVILAFVWGFKNKQFIENRGFLELNDSEESLQDAIILENRKNALKNQKKALFLDRDGVINKDFSYVYELEKLEFIPNIFEIVKFFQDKGYLIFIITNQSGVGRGYFTKEQMENFNNAIIKEFSNHQIKITKIYTCLHTPADNCECRKPKAGLIFSAANEFNIDLNNSIFIGDKPSDMQAAYNANIKNRYFFSDDFSEVSCKQICNLLDVKKDFE
ncbi:cbb3-type cytochrome oxidase assembly protein CcoS [Campylobacter sp. MG1]|uniref:cbb3-type cytochrome oxidase assembly protein CcoS n=1 Tax=Campylobacter sp. MG1 TaxID=2976332 RepID=UPI00226CC871|nr:cbb3-type cytochrome oxidase assembly protein CcoS [Campylobacter sp. MG1]